MSHEIVSARSQTVEHMNGGCVWCGGQFDQKKLGRPRKYCSTSCKQRSYESRKWGIGDVWEHLRNHYDECYLCGGSLVWSDFQSICLDHMIATVHGGRTNVENLRPVHLLCNARKGASLFIPDHLRHLVT